MDATRELTMKTHVLLPANVVSNAFGRVCLSVCVGVSRYMCVLFVH